MAVKKDTVLEPTVRRFLNVVRTVIDRRARRIASQRGGIMGANPDKGSKDQ